GERGAAGDAALAGACQQERAAGAQLVHLKLEKAVGVLRILALEGVAADDLGQPVGVMRGGAAHRAHLVEGDTVPALGELVRRLRARKSAADDGYICHALCLQVVRKIESKRETPGHRSFPASAANDGGANEFA